MLNNAYSTLQLFIFNNRFNSVAATYTNTTGGSVTLAKGTIMGRIAASGKLWPMSSTATDGSQIPIGILADDYTVADTVSITPTFCIGGDVDANALVFAHGGDTLNTAISWKGLDGDTTPTAVTVPAGTINDLLIRANIYAITSTEMTIADNS